MVHRSTLVKRQALFAEAGVNHINDYIKLFKESGTCLQKRINDI